MALAALLGIAFSPDGFAQPPADRANTPQRVALSQTVTLPCVSISVDEGTIVLPESELQRAAAFRRSLASAPVGNERQRLAWIAGDRAQALLAATGDTHNRFGCAAVDAAQVSGDGMYVVGALLERGQAAVLTRAPSGFAPAITAEHTDPQCQDGPHGSIVYRIADGGPLLLTLTECVR
ncbi:hypothetical protein M0D45_01910 [Xanthomonas prunicola]|uniref:hypothetical protein n=1 Tax=Xanthomonas prunicola TaxID=2053930 RepID=UPI0021B39437|nr:hypothetical protein [Xanthomonas prunicola]UXA53575.1 hypothetical protein M0D45_01910 [Xanthomonas prunicola]